MKKTIPGLRLIKLRSFTLVELLVVIAIIAILAGIIMSASTYAIKAAQKVKAFNMATQIQSGVTGYYTEYSLYPVTNGTVADTIITDVSGSSGAWQSLIFCLSGNNHPSTGKATPLPSNVITNSRGIAYLSMKVSDVDSTDAPKNPIPTGTSIYFNIAIDSDYDGVLGVSPSAVTTMPNFTATPFVPTSGGGTSSAGSAVWANCSGSTTTASSGNWVHTY